MTRSGGNQFHGNLFEYYRTPRLDAKSYPVTIAGLAKDQFVQHIFGGSFSGPLFNPGFGEGRGFSLLRDKAFFFVNLQLLRAYDTALVSRTVYTQAARQGLFRYVVGRANAPAGVSNASVNANGAPVLPNCIGSPPTNQPCIASYNIAANPAGITFDPTLTGVINSMPLPNNFSGGTGCTPDGLNTACFNFASPQHEKQYDFVTKLDFKIRDNSLLYLRYAEGKQDSLGDSANTGRPVFLVPNTWNLSRTEETSQSTVAGHDVEYTMKRSSNHKFNQFRYSHADPSFFTAFSTRPGTGLPRPSKLYLQRAWRDAVPVHRQPDAHQRLPHI